MVPQDNDSLRGYKLLEYYARDWGGDPDVALKAAERGAADLRAQRFFVRSIRAEMRREGKVYTVEGATDRNHLILRPNHWSLAIKRVKPTDEEVQDDYGCNRHAA